MLETSQLQTLVSVAKANSFSKAARELAVTQSAISQSIKNIEKRVGATIFKRSGKNVVLTREGKVLYQVAKESLGQIEQAILDIGNSTHSMKGELNIGTLHGIGKSWIGQELIEFADCHDELNIALQFGTPRSLTDDFLNNQLDALIVPDFCIPPSAEKFLIGEERSVLVFSKNVASKMDFEEFSKQSVILYEKEDPLYKKWCREIFGQVPRKLHRKFVVNSHGNVLKAVAKGLGVAVVPTHVLERSRFKGELKTFGKESEVLHSLIYLVFPENSGQNYKLLQLKNQLKENRF